MNSPNITSLLDVTRPPLSPHQSSPVKSCSSTIDLFSSPETVRQNKVFKGICNTRPSPSCSDDLFVSPVRKRNRNVRPLPAHNTSRDLFDTSQDSDISEQSVLVIKPQVNHHKPDMKVHYRRVPISSRPKQTKISSWIATPLTKQTASQTPLESKQSPYPFEGSVGYSSLDSQKWDSRVPDLDITCPIVPEISSTELTQEFCLLKSSSRVKNHSLDETLPPLSPCTSIELWLDSSQSCASSSMENDVVNIPYLKKTGPLLPCSSFIESRNNSNYSQSTGTISSHTYYTASNLQDRHSTDATAEPHNELQDTQPVIPSYEKVHADTKCESINIRLPIPNQTTQCSCKNCFSCEKVSTGCTKLISAKSFNNLSDSFIEGLHTGPKLDKSEVRKEHLNKFKDGQVIRKKSDRAVMHGADCPCCAGYYNALDLSPSTRKDRLDKVSRHRYVEMPFPRTPENYWELGFPDSAEQKKRGLVRTTIKKKLF